jgi:ribonucleotide reductase alpha subunit
VKIIKRDGSTVDFDSSKIVEAIKGACSETEYKNDINKINKIVDEIVKENKFHHNLQGRWLSVENVQDLVESWLMVYGMYAEAKRYILYRSEQSQKRHKEWDMTDLQRDVLHRKYIHDGENFNGFIKRVGNNEPKLMKAIRDRKFLFAGRVLDGRGSKEPKTYSNCFVLPSPKDNLEDIFDVGKRMAITYSLGGGCGVNLENLRPNGSDTHNSAEKSTGSVSFGSLYSFITGLISQKGRRGALMLSLPISHPDIKEFITIKSDLDKLTKANISVMITDDFMEAVRESNDFTTSFKVEHDNGETELIEKTYNAKQLFNTLAKQNHDFAEPGVLYWDRINNWYLLSEDTEYNYDSTNPCFTGDMKLLTSDGYKTFKELSGNNVELINNDGEKSNGSVWSNGIKNTVEVKFYGDKDPIKCTDDHVFMTNDGKSCEAIELQGKRIMPFVKVNNEINEYVKYGFLQGDGCLGRLDSDAHKGLEINLSSDDGDVRDLFGIKKHGRTVYINGYNDILSELGFSSNKLPTRDLPHTIRLWDDKDKRMFLKGLYSANGSVIKGYRVALKTTNKYLAKDVVELLSGFNIEAYITTNKSRKQKFSNGVYTMKESYDVNISRYNSIYKFSELIGFIHSYKNESLSDLIIGKSPVVSSIKEIGEEEVFDFNEPINNWGIVEGVIAHNCAEKPLPANSNCLLASINLSALVGNKFEDNAKFNFDEFSELVKLGVIQLNKVLDEGIDRLPFEENKQFGRDYRPIGLGYFGYGDMLIKLGMKYGSKEALEFTHKVGDKMIKVALETSALLAKEHGAFPKFKLKEVLESPFFKEHTNDKITKLVKEHGLYNAELLSIAPTGSLSLLAGTSSGIEPIYKISYTRKTESISEDGDAYYKVFTPIAREYMDKTGITNEDDLPDYFVTSGDLTALQRIKTQSVWQHYIDASISSTVNLHESATVEDVKDIYMLAWEYGLKGVTVFRDGCKRAGILGNHDKDKKDKSVKDMSVDDLQLELSMKLEKEYIDNPDECPKCGGELKHENGCEQCVVCGWSPCSI